MAPQNDSLLCASCAKGNPVSLPEARALVPTRTTPQCASGRDPLVLWRQGQDKAQARYKWLWPAPTMPTPSRLPPRSVPPHL